MRSIDNMPTESERNNNPSEFLPPDDRSLSPPITNNISGLTYGLTYNPNESIRSPLSPTNFVFDQCAGLSNGYYSTVNGITDFTAYNDYIHYAGGLPKTPTKFNVFNNLIKATQRFEIYSRKYRT